jgi:sensor histidine kinase YesM
LTIEFIVSKQTPKFVFRDIILAKQNVLYQQSVQYSVASMTYGVLFTLVGILLTCIYFVFFQHSVVFFSAIFYYFSGASALLVGLFWLDELGLFVYGYYLDLLNFMIGMSFLLLNLSLTDTSLTQKTAVGIAACFIAIFLSYPTFFVFSCVALFTISLMNFRNVSLFVLVLLVATIVATTIDNFNLLDSYIQNFSSAVARSFLYQLDYLALSLFAFYLLVLCSTKWKKKTLLNRQLVIQKKNLEIQLINKHIQPHFLMNALMSIQQQIENSPSNAIEMIDLLSQDFQLLHKQMGKSVIPLQEEIDICKGLCHLMEKTQVAKYKLLLSGNDLLIEIPPGLLFTLIENGIKHGYTGRNNGIFFITCAVKNKTLFICVENDGRSKNETYPCSGLGLHYVKEQLEAWKPNQWSFEAGPSELGWKNIITVSYFDGNIVQ